jgi:hypothetical protein
MSKKRNEWMCGYAAALRALAIDHGQVDLAAMIACEDHFSVEDFRQAGVDSGDLESFEAALVRHTARCAT